MSISWFDGVTITVEAALSADVGTYGAWDADLWNTATWGPGVVWVDVSDYVRSIATQRRFSREVNAWEAGTATLILDNRDGRFSPDNLSGPYVTVGVTQVRPWRPVRIRATYNAITYNLYTGYALDWVESWTVDRANRGDAIVTVPCVDELARLAAFDGYEQGPAGAGELFGQRIHRLLDNAAYTGSRAIEVGLTTMQATTLAANAVTELKLTADSEGGALFIDSDGTVVGEQQYALMENARSNTIQTTFGDGGGSELKYADVETAYSGDLLTNIAAFGRVGSTQQVAADASSRSLYGDRRQSRTDLICETDAQALALATFVVERFKQPEKRITSILLKPRRSPSNLYPQVLGRRVRDLVRVVRRPPGGHTVTRDCHIAGISHRITPKAWETTFGLWSATVYRTYSASRWDIGTWDSADTSWFF